MKEQKKQVEQGYSENINLICSECKHLESEANMRKIGNRLVCEECYDPKEQLDEQEYQELANNKEIKKRKIKQLSTNTNSKSDNSNEKSIEITNIEELNNQIEIPLELNIIDAPEDVSEDKEWFRKQFRNFWRLFNDKECDWTFIIHDRGTGKSKQSAILILYNIALYADFEGSFIMRNWDEPTRQTKEYFKKIINEFDETIWKGKKDVKGKWVLLWLSTYKGISYKKSLQDKTGELKCHFLDLFSPEQARTLINKPVRYIFFDECIPTRNQIKTGKGWKLDESSKYMEALESLARRTTPKKIFTGNPNDSFFNCWMLIEHFKPELIKFCKWYWQNRPKNHDAWLKWEWTKEWKKGNKRLQLKKVARKKKDFTSYEDDNWDIFCEKMEDMKLVEHKNSGTPQYVFNNTICYVSTQNYFYFIDAKSKEISERDRELIKNLPEYYVNDEQRLRSKQLAKWDRRGEKGAVFQQSLLRNYETNMLFFADPIAKELIENFIGKRKIIEV